MMLWLLYVYYDIMKLLYYIIELVSFYIFICKYLKMDIFQLRKTPKYLNSTEQWFGYHEFTYNYL